MLESVAQRAHGFVGADLENLCRESAIEAARRAAAASPGRVVAPEAALHLRVLPSDFLASFDRVAPSILADRK